MPNINLIEEAFLAVCKELGCENDNEAALIAADALRTRAEAAETALAEARQQLAESEARVERACLDAIVYDTFPAVNELGVRSQCIVSARKAIREAVAKLSSDGGNNAA